MLTITAEMRSARDVVDAMIARVPEGVAEHLEPATAALRLEVVAEAARNPRVAEIVRAADGPGREGLAATVRNARLAAGYEDGQEATDAMVEGIAAMFEGLQVRAIRNPSLDPARLAGLYRKILRILLTGPADDDPGSV